MEFREKHKAGNVKSRQKHKARRNEYYRKVYAESKCEISDKRKKRYREDVEYRNRKLRWNRQWFKDNRDKANMMQRRQYSKLKTSLTYRLNHTIRTGINKALRSKKAGRKWEQLVGYTLSELMAYLETTFDDSMSWENYGSYWHIDHIVPRSHFIYESPDEQGFEDCWALTNLAALEQSANRKKSNKMEAA